MKIGDILRSYRKKKGFTLKQLSNITGLSISFISDIENHRKKPSPENAKILADALNIDIRLLLDDKVAAMIDEIQEDVKSISNPDIRAIARAGKNLTPEQAEELRKFAERLFPDAFKNK